MRRRIKHQGVNFWPAYVDVMTFIAVAGFILLVQYASKGPQIPLPPDPQVPCGFAGDIMHNVMETVNATVRREVLTEVPDKCRLRIEEGFLFGYDKVEPKPEGIILARKIARGFINVLRDKNNLEKIELIMIEGHADNLCSTSKDINEVERINYGKSVLRAESIYSLFVDEINKDKSDPYTKKEMLMRIGRRGFGSHRGIITDCKNKGSCSPNRRVEIVVYGAIGAK